MPTTGAAVPQVGPLQADAHSPSYPLNSCDSLYISQHIFQPEECKKLPDVVFL